MIGAVACDGIQNEKPLLADNFRNDRTLAAEAGSQPKPLAPTCAFASMIS